MISEKISPANTSHVIHRNTVLILTHEGWLRHIWLDFDAQQSQSKIILILQGNLAVQIEDGRLC